LHADASIREEIRRVSENHVEPEIKFVQEFGAIALEEGKKMVFRFIE
jgi:hypothetical protein